MLQSDFYFAVKLGNSQIITVLEREFCECRRKAAKLHALPLGLKGLFASIPDNLCNTICITGKVANYNSVFIFLAELYCVYLSRRCVFIEPVEIPTTRQTLISARRCSTELKNTVGLKGTKFWGHHWRLWCWTQTWLPDTSLGNNKNLIFYHVSVLSAHRQWEGGLYRTKTLPGAMVD